MPKWLVVLIAAACVVVIAGGGVFAFRGYQDYRQKQDSAAIQATCLSTTFELAKYIKTESALDDTATQMTRKVRVCMAALHGTGFAETAEGIVHGSGYTLTGSPNMLPLAP